MIVLLDASALGRVTSPPASTVNEDCRQWLASLLTAGVQVRVPEIADYEVRRGLQLAGSAQGIAALDRSHLLLGYIPITTEAMRQAAECWAQARRLGRPTASDAALDGDVILCPQAVALAVATGDSVVIATENLKHLTLFTQAEEWRKIRPPTP